MLRQAFATAPALRGRPLFRRKAFSRAACTAAYLYGATRRWLPALRCVLRSVLLWPWPYRRGEIDGRACARLRMATVLLLRMLGLLPPDPGFPELAPPPIPGPLPAPETTGAKGRPIV
jgi:hypothetical protein